MQMRHSQLLIGSSQVQLRLLKPSEDGQTFAVDDAAPVHIEQRVEPDSYEMEVRRIKGGVS